MICHLELYEIGPSSDEWSELSGDTHVTITASQDSLLSRQLLMFTLLERKDSSMRMCTFVQICLLTTLFTIVQADTPANCSFKEVEGDWTFYIGDRGYDKTLNCSGFGYGKNAVESKLKVKLLFPDTAIDEFGNEGFWTLIYNQGFEVVLRGRKYFAFSKYTETESICDETLPGWSHDIFGHNWACFYGTKEEHVQPKPFRLKQQSHTDLHYRHNPLFINEINRKQNSWKAVKYPQYEGMSIEGMIRMAGGRKSRIPNIPAPAPKSNVDTSKLPDYFDWRDMNGINYVSPVRNQGSCGSCYAFASMGMDEARVRIVTNNTEQPVFSPQDIVECSEYSQGCEGGFPYLIGGKYAEDFGLVEEECNPYKGKDGACSTDKSCNRSYFTRYQYVGGFYGACNDELMRMNLVKNGPMAVAFEVYNDFFHYKSGIYHHTGLTDKFNPFEITNHAVLLVGYGTDTTDPENPQNYWIVKNSWGESWGEDGYFKIMRGVDECSIESIAVESFPIL